MLVDQRFEASIYQGGSVRIHGRITEGDKAGTLLTQSAFGAIDYWITDQSTKELVVSVTRVTTSDVLSDETDEFGDNFHLVLPAESFPNGRTVYEVTIRARLPSGETGMAVVELDSMGVP